MTGLQARLCPIHRDEPLVCSECDLMELTDDKRDELARLLESAGYLDREPLQSVGTCWRCGKGALWCLECAYEREEPMSMARMNDGELERLPELRANLVPPWL
jgi:hypothetical protein